MSKSPDSVRATTGNRFVISHTAKKFGNIRTAAAIVVSTVMLLSGCALTDPYARWTVPEKAEVTQQTDITLPYAIAYAQKARDAYRVVIGTIYAALGETDTAFEWLDRGYEIRSQDLMGLKTDPGFDPLRSDPRYAVLLRQVRLE